MLQVNHFHPKTETGLDIFFSRLNDYIRHLSWMHLIWSFLSLSLSCISSSHAITFCKIKDVEWERERARRGGRVRVVHDLVSDVPWLDVWVIKHFHKVWSIFNFSLLSSFFIRFECFRIQICIAVRIEDWKNMGIIPIRVCCSMNQLPSWFTFRVIGNV